MGTTLSTAESAVDTIRRARQVFEERGWIKGTLENKSGVCLLRALQIANGPGVDEAKRIIYNCIGMPIPRWNDNLDRTFEDISTVLDAAECIAKELAT